MDTKISQSKNYKSYKNMSYMAEYYSEAFLKAKVEQLGQAIGMNLKVIKSDGLFFIDSASYLCEQPFTWAGWYHTSKDLIIYIDGILAGIEFAKR